MRPCHLRLFLDTKITALKNPFLYFSKFIKVSKEINKYNIASWHDVTTLSQVAQSTQRSLLLPISLLARPMHTRTPPLQLLPRILSCSLNVIFHTPKTRYGSHIMLWAQYTLHSSLVIPVAIL